MSIVLLAAVQGLFIAALLAAFGTALFAAVVTPLALHGATAACATAERRRLRNTATVEIVLAACLLVAWIAAESRDLAGTVTVAPAVLRGTTFGQFALAQACAILAALIAWLGRSRTHAWLAAALLAVAVCLQLGHAHAWAARPRSAVLLLAGLVHLLAAGAWLGGLPPLLLMVLHAPAKVAANASRWFSPLGKACVAVLAGSAIVQFALLIGGWHGLAATAYGHVAVVKLGLFAALLALAIVNRYRLAPALLRDRPERTRRVLLCSLAVQTCLGVAAVAAAAILGSLPPAIHRAMAM